MCKNNNIEDKEPTWIYKCRFGILVLLAIILVAHFVQACISSRDVNKSDYHEVMIDSIVLVKPDSATIAIDTLQLKTLICRVDSMREMQRQFYDNYLSDLRQESNNNINKYNGWLSFWIALLTIVLGVIPFMMSYKVNSYHKEYLDFLIRKTARELKDQVETDLQDDKKAIKKLKEEIDLTQGVIKKLGLQTMAEDINIAKNNKLLTDTRERSQLWATLLLSFGLKLEDYTRTIKYLVKDGVTEEQVTQMREVLIHAHYVLGLWFSQANSKLQSKQAVKMLDTLKEMILKDTDNTSTGRQSYYSDFTDIVSQYCRMIKERV